jgi:hypothetical protein
MATCFFLFWVSYFPISGQTIHLLRCKSRPDVIECGKAATFSGLVSFQFAEFQKPARAIQNQLAQLWPLSINAISRL